MRSSETLDRPYTPQGVWSTRGPALRVVARLLSAQVGIGVGISLLWALDSVGAMVAGLAGTLIALLPTAYYAAKVFSKAPGTPPRQVVRAFYVGEVVRLILTAALFIIALRWFSGDFVPLITTYAAALSSYWLILLGALRT
ncbi:hypothetical protein CKO15_02820 [Halorhodospira abdelmalekii]|uniref:ATP synthase subunit I n=1 Tax=Halorhodospira abdelmalekii TaxID=421629 RepID=UPI001903B3B7|nr:ATP synthase subunit I [Halorhodospira abdelmalekii]MBK1734231.1 hypothetical protein [Halorhodospira abdelmalekii]